MALHEEVKNGDRGRNEERHGDLVRNEVGHRVEIRVFGGKIRVAGSRSEVKTPGSGNERGGRKGRDAEPHEDRVHRHEKEHREARSARDEDVHELADKVGEREHEIGRIELRERARKQIRHARGGADSGHVFGVACGRHDDEAESGNARTHDRRNALEGIKAFEARRGNLLREQMERSVKEPEL